MSGGRASSRSSTRIEQSAPELERIISASEPIQHLADGFGGALGPAEGPVWWKEGHYLLFSDIHNDKRMKYEPGKGVTVFREPTNRANGLTRDLQGRLIACEHDSRRVTRQELDGSTTVVANSFQGRRLNRPNDVVVKSDGCVYFTDPWTSPAAPEQWDLTFSGVYRVTPDLGSMSLLIDDFVLPNGLAFSPDETILYVVDTGSTLGTGGPNHIRAFHVRPDSSLSPISVLAVDEGKAFDGLRVDTEGRLWAGTGQGINCYLPTGQLIGRIRVPERVANLEFAGFDRRQLMLCGTTSLYTIPVRVSPTV